MNAIEVTTASAEPDQGLRRPSGPANITLHIEEFSGKGKGFIKHRMVLTNPGDSVKQPRPDLISVKSGGANLVFMTVPADFRPVDIAFKDAAGLPVPIDGGGPFRNMKVSPSTLEIEDSFPMPEGGKLPLAKTYKFSVTVRQVSSGDVGVIDPYVENEN